MKLDHSLYRGKCPGSCPACAYVAGRVAGLEEAAGVLSKMFDDINKSDEGDNFANRRILSSALGKIYDKDKKP
jgi:hypothetical protein